MHVLDNILYEKNDLGWNAQNPQGAEGDELMKVTTEMYEVLSKSIKFHVMRGDVLWGDAELVEATNHMCKFD